jgi:hypothetical protein
MEGSLHYGAWLEIREGKTSAVLRWEQDDFLRHLQKAFDETKDLPQALQLLKARVIKEIRKS